MKMHQSGKQNSSNCEDPSELRHQPGIQQLWFLLQSEAREEIAAHQRTSPQTLEMTFRLRLLTSSCTIQQILIDPVYIFIN
ncbi:hypothetical protein CHARACLAT_030325 [Characodon lateralis]|uniref:Uncharacterized protein n=1 Tax=Characodon lateralis TaxID=208331 RepID=A0ABU7F876_9TELE|nr:hypothetical protein [Characodon lateralis]